MTSVFVVSDNIVSPLGITTEKNFSQLKSGVSGIKQHHDLSFSELPFHASLMDKQESLLSALDLDKTQKSDLTRFEQLLVLSVQQALSSTDISLQDKRTVLIISTTKGNISLIETGTVNHDTGVRVALHTSATRVAGYFNYHSTPVIISNACISGSLAILTGFRLIRSGRYDHAVIAGADVITKFIYSGFQSFQALSAEPCKPFDASRNGITLGEGAGTIVLSSAHENDIRVKGGSVSNDANHISGPSRTGQELGYTISTSMKMAGLAPGDIDFISAHGTATLYNDEMEANAIRLSGLLPAPVNSLKGYYGHTLGAAGLIESIVSMQTLRENMLLPTKGFSNTGVSSAVKVNNKLLTGAFKNFIKTASGFGGCNAALVIGK